jgi:hypothetical protein
MTVMSGPPPMPIRPPMDPASGIRRVKLRPHEMTQAVTATEDLFVLAHLGVPRIDPAHWSLRVDGLVRGARSFGLFTRRCDPRRETRR